MYSAVALLGAMLLLREDSRLALAPLYAAGLLLVAELGVRSIELRAVESVGPGVVAARLGVVLAVAALGACAAAGAAIAVTVAPARSAVFTAVGAIAALSAFGAITRLARGRRPTTVLLDTPDQPGRERLDERDGQSGS